MHVDEDLVNNKTFAMYLSSGAGYKVCGPAPAFALRKVR
jgi:hypothetical protein